MLEPKIVGKNGFFCLPSSSLGFLDMGPSSLEEAMVQKRSLVWTVIIKPPRGHIFSNPGDSGRFSLQPGSLW